MCVIIFLMIGVIVVEQNKRKVDIWNILLVVVAVILIGGFIFYLFSSSTFANSNNPFIQNTSFSTLKLDEMAYGSTVFDSSNLELRTMLDKDVRASSNQVIYISFLVGGNENNNAEDPVYDIALQDLEVDCDLISPYVKWKLLKNGKEISNGSLDYQFDTIRNGRLVLTPIQQDLKNYSKDKSTYDHYEFYLWLSDSCQEEDIELCDNSEVQNYLLGKKIRGKVEVELYSKTKKELVRHPSDILDTNTCILNQ